MEAWGGIVVGLLAFAAAVIVGIMQRNSARDHDNRAQAQADKSNQVEATAATAAADADKYGYAVNAYENLVKALQTQVRGFAEEKLLDQKRFLLVEESLKECRAHESELRLKVSEFETRLAKSPLVPPA